MYQLTQVGIADAQRLIGWASDNVFGAKCNLKGFDYAWITTSRRWSADDRILEVGAGYSALPLHLADQFRCEVWAVDDFGLHSGDEFWARDKNPLDHIRTHPQVKYVVERLGDIRTSSLPESYFDCIYSASALEHVPTSDIRNVWQHMDRLLKPGGQMLHALDVVLPTRRGLLSLAKALAVDNLWPLLPAGFQTRNAYYTPTAYLRLATSALRCHVRVPKRALEPLRMVLDPHVVVEPLDWALNRLRKDGLRLDFIPRTTSLYIDLRKVSNEAYPTR